MRMILQIAKAELRNLFYSPVAWFLILAFLVQCAWFYMNGLAYYANMQDILIRNDPSYAGLTDDFEIGYTRRLFIGKEGFFSNVLQNLYLFIPLLTMALIGREVQSGTSRLLYSSPVKLREIVIGKYLAIMLYNLLLVLIVGIFIVTTILSVKEVDYGMLLSATLGFYLLTCAYTAIGMFMSSITTHQIIAAVSTFLIIFCLNFIGSLWQRYDFVRDLTFFLHLPGRAEKMLKGLITSKDVIYFLAIVCMFMGFTILRLRAARESKPWYVSFMRYSMVVMFALMTGYISSRPMLTGYWDTTTLDRNTIHKKTQQLIREMGDEPLEVTLYTNLLGPGKKAGLPEDRNIYLSKLWEPYLRFKPDIKFNYVYYYDHDSSILGNKIYRSLPGKSMEYIAAKYASNLDLDTADFLKPAEIRKMIDLRPENLRLVMQVKYKGRSEFLRTYGEYGELLWPSEINVAPAFKRLIQGRAPKVAFVTGHFERNIYKTGEREFATHTTDKEKSGALINLGFDVDTINLDREDIPTDLTTLVLADPKSELSPLCQEKIRQYLSGGGNMFIFGEPGKQQMVNPVLKQLGVSLMDGVLVSKREREMPDIQNPPVTNAFLSILLDPSGSAFKRAPEKEIHILMQRATAIDYSDTAGFSNHPLLTMPAGFTWLKKGRVVVDSAMVEFNEQDGDMRAYFASSSKTNPGQHQHGTTETGHAHDTNGAFAALLAMHRTINNKEQRVVVAGDADFLSNWWAIQGKYGVLMHSWLCDGAYPVYMPFVKPVDILLTIKGKTAERLRILYLWILPGLTILGATALLIRRKRK